MSRHYLDGLATKEVLANHCGTHKNTRGRSLNQFIDDGILERISEKQRDPEPYSHLRNIEGKLSNAIIINSFPCFSRAMRS